MGELGGASAIGVMGAALGFGYYLKFFAILPTRRI